jgi:hypothetical protein
MKDVIASKESDVEVKVVKFAMFGSSTRRQPRLSANVATPRRMMSARSLEIRAMALISSQNHPMLVRTFKGREEDELKFHYVAHTALDVIEERRGYQPFS